MPGFSATDKGQYPELQLQPLRDYCRARGWEIAGEYVDIGQSGAKDRRPELDRLKSADFKLINASAPLDPGRGVPLLYLYPGILLGACYRPFLEVDIPFKNEEFNIRIQDRNEEY